MLLLRIAASPSLSYWLNWRVLLCALLVLIPMIVAIYIIWKYEGSLKHSESHIGEIRDRRSLIPLDDVAWRPCIEGIPPSILLLFRVISFCLLLVALCFEVAAYGADLFFYYTQWTLTLVTIYFGVGSLLSLYGCFQHNKITQRVCDSTGVDMEHGLYSPLSCEEAKNGKKVEKLGFGGEVHNRQSYGLQGCIFQILFQMTAGAVMLTDSVYWIVILPFLTITDYELSFLTVVVHSLNLVLLLGDTALNSLHFPWFRISYFILWTGTYVIFEWMIHVFELIWWPYPFLDLSSAYAPLWYLIAAIWHVPSFGIFALIVKLKEFMFARWFPESYWSLR